MTPVYSHAENLRVAVASNFAPTLVLIAQQFEKKYSHHIDVIKGSTGKFYAQIKQGAPYHVFLAADALHPQLLEQESLIVPNSRYTYAIGKLVLWSPKHPKDVLEILRGNKFNKLAIANPRIAPYGQAAIEVLQQLELYDQIKTKLVYGENVAQAFQYVQSGNAELGFIPLSLVRTTSLDYWLPAENAYHKLEQQLVILKTSKKQALAKSFVDFIKREDTRALIQAQGYETP